jgi:hypothetical protein
LRSSSAILLHAGYVSIRRGSLNQLGIVAIRIAYDYVQPRYVK